MLSRQILKQVCKANTAALSTAKRFSSDATFPIRNTEMHLHEPYEAFVGRNGILWQATPTKISKTQVRANFKAGLLKQKAEADKLYSELSDADKEIFNDYFKVALDPKQPVESGVFKPFGPHGKNLTVFHNGGYVGLLRNCLRTRKNFFVMLVSVVFALVGTSYMFVLSLYNIRAYFDGILHPHH